ncbi:hypothetical protein ACPWT1_01775 [Ramlibacter sp. MMS24-I3-19]|uniref:hypothetical protein n=1 Tax=Ramlibacter sp. MMS24-I3-19 TaxID=3416606 RepID=UPI003D016F02
MPLARFVLISLLSGVGCCAVHAQAIYRCGDSYSQQPCAGGRQLEPGAPPPSAADRSQAAAHVARDARLADTLERDRTRREAQAGQASVVLPSPEPEQFEPHKSPEKAATRKLDMFTASVPGSRTPKAKPAKKAAPKETKTAADRKSGSVSGASGKTAQPVKTAAAAAKP